MPEVAIAGDSGDHGQPVRLLAVVDARVDVPGEHRLAAERFGLAAHHAAAGEDLRRSGFDMLTAKRAPAHAVAEVRMNAVARIARFMFPSSLRAGRRLKFGPTNVLSIVIRQSSFVLMRRQHSLPPLHVAACAAPPSGPSGFCVFVHQCAVASNESWKSVGSGTDSASHSLMAQVLAVCQASQS